MKKIAIIGIVLVVAMAATAVNDALDTLGVKSITGVEMVYDGGGAFTMGDILGDKYQPNHHKPLSSYYIGQYEVIVAEWRQFAKATGYITLAEKAGDGEILSATIEYKRRMHTGIITISPKRMIAR